MDTLQVSLSCIILYNRFLKVKILSQFRKTSVKSRDFFLSLGFRQNRKGFIKDIISMHVEGSLEDT